MASSKGLCPRCGADGSLIHHLSGTALEEHYCTYCHTDIPAHIGLVLDAVDWAITRHHGQYRSSADGAKIPYVTHCIEVARRVAAFRVFPAYVLEAAVLHDVVEDTDTSLSDVRFHFQERVARIVDTLTTAGPGISVKQKLANQHKAIPTMSFFEMAIKVADKTSNVKSIADFAPAWPIKNQRGYIQDSSGVVDAIINRARNSEILGRMVYIFRETKEEALEKIADRKEQARS